MSGGTSGKGGGGGAETRDIIIVIGVKGERVSQQENN